MAVDHVSQRVYWTTAGARDGGGGGGGGGVHVAALDGRRRAALYRRDGCEPDDIVLHNETR